MSRMTTQDIIKTKVGEIRVLVQPVSTVPSASIGLWCSTGSAFEGPHEAGITHLVEHMLFKGTSKRSAKDIAEAIEGRGGHINAFTSKEITCYYCRVLAEDARLAIDVLSDMVIHSTLDSKDLELEKGVVLEEIKRTEDEPSDLVHDLHCSNLWPGDPLGKPIIGTSESVSSFDSAALKTYLTQRYHGNNLVLSVAGNVDPAEIHAIAQDRLGEVASGEAEAKRGAPVVSSGSFRTHKSVEQVHFCVGASAPSIHADDLPVAYVMDSILGSGMSSRLFQEVREKRGLAYSIGSYLQSFQNGGAFTVYGGTSIESWPEVLDLIQQEFLRIAEEGVPAEELERVKRNIRGEALLALESMNSRMMRMAKNEINFGREVPLEEWLGRISAVTASDLQEHAARSLQRETLVITAIGPFEN